jgi:hypothetical protein
LSGRSGGRRGQRGSGSPTGDVGCLNPNRT